MAQDSGSQNPGKPQEVDLDELEVEILILGKNLTMLNASAAFLTRRGWPTTVMNNMSKAIEYIAEKRPDFVLVSLSHPNPAITKLPELITQTFNLSCVGFIEVMDAPSQTKLNQFKMRYKIQGAPSGPNLQRSIRKMLAEKFNIKTDEGRTSAVAASKENGVERNSSESISIAGSNVTTIKGGASEGSTRDSTRDSKSERESGIGYMPTQQSQAASTSAVSSGGKTGIGYMPTAQGSADTAEAPDTDSEVVSTGKYTMSSKKNRKSLKDFAQAGAQAGIAAQPLPDGPDVGVATAGTNGSGDLIANLKKSLFGDGGTAEDEGDDGEVISVEGLAQPVAGTAPVAAGGLVPTLPVTDAGQKPIPIVPSPEVLATLPPANLLERAVTATLRRVCRREDATETRPLMSLTKVAVFPIDSKQLGGYLIVGVEQDPTKIEDFFLKACEEALREEMATYRVPGQIENGFWVHIPEVEFSDWTLNKARFQMIVPHQSSEVGIAYFPVDRPLPKPQGTEENGMYSIAIDDISTEQPINFKAYLHLKKNKKYFLYLRNGRHLQPEQKQRLKGRKVKDIFMKKVDVDNLRMYLAASFLRDSIKKAA